MEVYALIGASGTGKSHNAISVANEYNIEVFIDDGLLIKDGKKMAGSSAKAEATMTQAVKRAIFNDAKHASEVRERIKQLQPKRILILGTSEKMISRILVALDLPQVKQKIFIQEIASSEQIAVAKRMRQDGKHVIPLPSIEVKKDLPNYWIDPIKGFFTKKMGHKTEGEKSIVRPKFSQLGKLTISEGVIEQMVGHIMGEFEQLDRGAKIQVVMNDFGVNVFCEMKIRYGVPIQATIENFQERVIAVVDELTSLSILKIDIRITGVVG